jgi:pimeloyl-ACP methyl ester carboxylesterase
MTEPSDRSGHNNLRKLLRDDGETLAYLERSGQEGAGVLWLGGFKSEMTGIKAACLDRWAERTNTRFVRFDYFGHGQSSGAFESGTVTRWRDDALAILDRVTHRPQVLVGSSMGAWIAVLAALARPERVAGLVLIAPAVDFTEALIWQRAPEDIRHAIMEYGVWHRPSAYDPAPYPITRTLIEDGRKHLLLNADIAVTCPVRILQGMADPDVPWSHAVRLAERLQSNDLVITIVKDADHRLSDGANLARLTSMIEELTGLGAH